MSLEELFQDVDIQQQVAKYQYDYNIFFLTDILVNASSINNHVVQEEQQLVKAVQDSMAEWKIRSSKHR